MEAAMNEVLLARARGPSEAGRRDDASETSSVSSEGRSVNGIAMDIPDIIAHMSSGLWSDRRDGLVSLQMFLQNDRQMSPFDVKKVTEIFTRMFHDPSPKVFGVYLETLPRLLRSHAADVQPEWVYVALSKLLTRMASEQLSSVLGKVGKALKAVREEFEVEDQLKALSKFVCDSNKMNDAKSRTVFLDYLHDLAVSMDSSELSNCDSIQQLAIRVIAWSSEPKCPNIRKLSQNVVISLFNVNTPEFYSVLNALPRSIRDAGYEILQNHLSSVTQDLEPTPPPTNEFSAHAARPAADCGGFRSLARDEADEDRMSTEEFYASLKKTSEDIQNLNRLEF
jgi:CLIP-associating protein 1/2